MFIDRIDLFKPGNKKNLLMLLIKYLYFTYTITTHPLPDDPPDEQNVTLQIVNHLEPPILRNHEKYPQSIIEIMDYMNFDHSDTISVVEKPLHHEEFADDATVSTLGSLGSGTLNSMTATRNPYLVTVSEELKIAKQPVQGSGKANRRIARILKEKLELEEQERQRLAWLAIPKRKRGLICGYCFRGKGRLFVLAAYISPLRPSTVSIRGYHPSDCSRVSMSLGLTLLGARNKMAQKPTTWSSELLHKTVRKSVREIKAGGNFAGKNKNTTKLMLDDYGGIETELCDVKATCQSHVAHLLSKRERLVDLDSGHCFNERNAEKVYNPKHLPLVDRLGYSPARDIGKGLRLYSRVKKIHGIRCILTIYLGNKKLIRGAIPSIGEDVDAHSSVMSTVSSQPLNSKEKNKKNDDNADEDSDDDDEDSDDEADKEKPHVSHDTIDDNSKLDGGSTASSEAEMMSVLSMQSFVSQIARKFSIDVVIYVPQDAYYDNYLIPACTTFRASLVKDDLYRILTDRDQFFYCMNVCYSGYVHSADANEWGVMEAAWGSIADDLIAKSKWGLRYASNGPIVDNLSNIHKAEALLSIDASIVKPGSSASTDPLIWPPIPDVVLSWPVLYYRKLLKIPSQVASKPDPKFLTDIWYKYKRMGVICYDMENMDAFFIDLPDSALASTTPTQHFTPFDKSITLSIFLQSSLVYVENKDENGDVYNEVVYNDGEIDIEMTEDILEDDTAYEDAIAASIANRPQMTKKKGAVEDKATALLEETYDVEIN